MIDFYTWTTPNGRKVSIMLQELGLDYTEHAVHIGKGEQFEPDFVKLSPLSKIPVIVDHDGPSSSGKTGGGDYTVFESGAILIYLAEKSGSDLLPTDARARMDTLQWLMFQMGNVGPMLGQAHVFLWNPKEVVPVAQKRYHDIAHKLYAVMDTRLGSSDYLAGPAYTIADIATYPWVSRCEHHCIPLDDYPNVKRWFDIISARPAVERGMKVLGKPATA